MFSFSNSKTLHIATAGGCAAICYNDTISPRTVAPPTRQRRPRPQPSRSTSSEINSLFMSGSDDSDDDSLPARLHFDIPAIREDCTPTHNLNSKHDPDFTGPMEHPFVDEVLEPRTNRDSAISMGEDATEEASRDRTTTSKQAWLKCESSAKDDTKPGVFVCGDLIWRPRDNARSPRPTWDGCTTPRTSNTRQNSAHFNKRGISPATLHPTTMTTEADVLALPPPSIPSPDEVAMDQLVFPVYPGTTGPRFKEYDLTASARHFTSPSSPASDDEDALSLLPYSTAMADWAAATYDMRTVDDECALALARKRALMATSALKKYLDDAFMAEYVQRKERLRRKRVFREGL